MRLTLQVTAHHGGKSGQDLKAGTWSRNLGVGCLLADSRLVVSWLLFCFALVFSVAVSA